ncbi:MAG: prepilin-type N-terminal cleavage/methylation domain-containing protein [Candidatus Gastranaerophilales bacterium]|nr:prepilin-type N-terminal cleavage/methylation domain-containing protein [Candidatus Gastranaerophilales bacterium]
MYQQTTNKKHRAFTLAEVLITLLIIGVISSIVIPGLINDTKEAEYNVGVKKIYAELIQATMQIQSPDSDVIIPSTNDPIGVRSAYGSVFSFIKTDTAGNIWGTVGAGSSSTYRNYKGTAPAYMHLYDYKPAAILANGTFIGFTSPYRESNGWHEIYVDINGSKGPNMQGVDVYLFILLYTNGYYKLLPNGAAGTPWGTPSDCAAGSTSYYSSWPCTARRLLDPEHMP